MRALLMSWVISLAVVGGAAAGSIATLPAETTKPRMLIVDGRVWRCAGLACQASGRGRSQGLVRECARVARKVGRLAAYSRDGVLLERAALERCNREARAR